MMIMDPKISSPTTNMPNASERMLLVESGAGSQNHGERKADQVACASDRGCCDATLVHDRCHEPQSPHSSICSQVNDREYANPHDIQRLPK
jgi:hypothetical protein